MRDSPSKTPVWIKALAVFAIVFGAVTLKAGGTVLFGGEAARQGAGDYVLFVLWFNFVAGFAYVAAGIGLWLRTRWAAALATLIAAATAIVFAAFGVHILLGGAFEMRTVWAMAFRTAVWIALALVAQGGSKRR